MHFFRRISVKNALITIQYINDWVKGLRICHACARMPEPWGYRWRYILWIPRAAVNICKAVAGDPSWPP